MWVNKRAIKEGVGGEGLNNLKLKKGEELIGVKAD